jgi:WD40 repeat protein
MTSPVESRAPADRTWVVAIHSHQDSTSPIGAGVVVDARRVLTCAHVVARTPAPWVAFPNAENPFGPLVPVGRVRASSHRQADVAVLELAAPLPAGVTPARLRLPKGADVVGRRWWAYGFRDEIGNEADGVVGADLTFGWVRVDGESRYHLEKGFSGGGLWSPDYDAVVGLLGQAHANGDGRGFMLSAAANVLTGEDLGALAESRVVEAAGADAALSWGWALATDPEGRRHWRPRSRGVSGDSERGYRFHGRRVALTEIVEWLGTDRPEPKVLVVTGSPGVGKSAVLARVVTTADRAIAADLPVDDTAVRAPVGSVACAVHAKGKTALEVATEIARAASAPLPERVEDAVPALREALADQGGHRFTVVVDALDEAAGPAQARLVVRKVLVPLAETCADVGARVLVGTRRRDDGGDLIGEFGRARREIDLDVPRYFAAEDLVGYALATLQLRGAERRGSPYADLSVAAPLAARIATVARQNFLVAGLVARTHGLHDVAAVPPGVIGMLDGDPVAAALREYLSRIPGAGQVTATEALTALAYAEAPGLTPDLWRLAVAAVTGRDVAEPDLASFAQGSAANFLVESSGTAAAYRLFHQALNDSLVASRDSAADQRSIVRAFVAAGRAAGWSQPYLRRSLAHHAAEGGDVDTVLAEPGYLLHADLRRLIPAAGAARTAAGRERARLLRRTAPAVTAGPEQRLGLFSLTEAFDRLGSDFRTLASPSPYRAVWAHARRGAEETSLEGHTGRVNGVCGVRAGDRDLLASAGDDRTVRLWDPVTGELVRTLDGHTDWVTAVCGVRAGDRDLLASGADDGTVRLWEPLTGELVRTLDGLNGSVGALCAVRAGDHDLLALADDDGAVRLWDPVTGEPIHTLDDRAGGVGGLCAVRAGDRTLLAVSGNDATVRLWDPATGEPIHTLDGHTGPVWCLSAVRAGDGDLLATAGADETVRLWDPVTGDAVHTIEARSDWLEVMCGVRAGTRDLLATSGEASGVRLWDVATGEPVRTLEGHGGAVLGLSAIRAGDRDLLATGDDDGGVRLWNPATGEHVRTLEGHSGWVNGVCAIPAGEHDLLATAGEDSTVRLWDAGTGEHVRTLEGHASWVKGVSVIRAGDHDLLASTGIDGTVRLWNPVTGEPVRTLEGRYMWISSVCAVRAGDRDLLAMSTAETVQVWDPVSAEPVRVLRGHTAYVNDVCTLRAGDHDLLASAGGDGTVRLWDPATGEPVLSLEGHAGPVNGVCVVRAGGHDLLASAGNDRTVRLWDPATGELVRTLDGHTSWVTAVCTVRAGDRDLLASAGEDRTVRLWDPATGRSETVVPVQYPALDVASLGHGRVGIGLADGVLVIDVGGASGTTGRTTPGVP